MKGRKYLANNSMRSPVTSPTARSNVYVAVDDQVSQSIVPLKIRPASVGAKNAVVAQNSVVVPTPKPTRMMRQPHKLKKRKEKGNRNAEPKGPARTVRNRPATPSNSVFLPNSLSIPPKTWNSAHGRPKTAPFAFQKMSNQISPTKHSRRVENRPFMHRKGTIDNVMRQEKTISKSIRDEIESMKQQLPLEFLNSIGDVSLQWSRGLKTITKHLKSIHQQQKQRAFNKWVKASNHIAIETQTGFQLAYDRTILMSKVGKTFLKCIRAHTKQHFTHWHHVVSEMSLLEKTKAVIQIQGVVRCAVARKRVADKVVEKLNRKARVIQRRARGSIVRIRIHKSQAASSIQAAWRVKKLVEEQKLQLVLTQQKNLKESAVKSIQRFFRTCLFRLHLEVGFLRNSLERSAARCIQRAFRSMKARRFGRACVQGRLETEAEVQGLLNFAAKEAIRHASAIRIQRLFRRYSLHVASLAGTFIAKHAIEFSRNTIAAVRIQNCFRWFLVKQLLRGGLDAVDSALNAKATHLHSYLRMFLAKIVLHNLKLEQLRRNNSATTIQRHCRGYFARQFAIQFKTERTEAACTIQRIYRGVVRHRRTRRVMRRIWCRRRHIKSTFLHHWLLAAKEEIAARERARMLKLEQMAQEHHRVRSLSEHFAAWQEVWKQNLGPRHRKRIAGHRFRHKVIGRAWQKWCTEWQLTVAWKKWIRCLIFLGFDLKYYNSSRQGNLVSTATLMNSAIVSRNHFVAWKEEVVRMKELMVFAAMWREERFLGRAPKICYQDWKAFVEYKQYWRLQHKRAESHYMTKTKPKVFSRWVQYLKQVRRKKRNILLAIKFYKTSCKRAHFMRWAFFKNLLQENRRRIQEIIRSKDFVVYTKVFRILLEHCKRSLRKKAEWKRVSSHMARFHRNRILSRWRVFSAKQWRAKRLMAAMQLQTRWRIRALKLRQFREKMKVAYANKVTLQSFVACELTEPVVDREALEHALEKFEFCVILFSPPHSEFRFKRQPNLGVPQAVLLRTVEHLSKQAHRLGVSPILPLSRGKPLVGVVQVDAGMLSMEEATALGAGELPSLCSTWTGWCGLPSHSTQRRNFVARMRRLGISMNFAQDEEFSKGFKNIVRSINAEEVQIDVSRLSKRVVSQIDGAVERIKKILDNSARVVQTRYRTFHTQKKFKLAIQEFTRKREEEQYENDVRTWERTGWERKQDPSGTTFYWNHKLGVSLPTHPDAVDPAQLSSRLGVVTSTGLTFVLDVKLGDTIAILKKVIEVRIGVLPMHQRLALRPVGVGPNGALIHPKNNNGPLAALTIGWEVEVMRESMEEATWRSMGEKDKDQGDAKPHIQALVAQARGEKCAGPDEWVRGTIVEIQDDLYTVNPGNGEAYIRGIPRANIRLIEVPNEEQLINIHGLVNGSLLELFEEASPKRYPNGMKHGIICSKCSEVIAVLRCIECKEVMCQDCCWKVHMENNDNEVMSRAHRFVPIDDGLLDLMKPTSQVPGVGGKVVLHDKEVKNYTEHVSKQSETNEEPVKRTGQSEDSTTKNTETPSKANMLNIFRRRKSKSSNDAKSLVIACQICAVRCAAGLCKNCNKFYCQLCFQHGHRLPATSNVMGSIARHQVVLVTEVDEIHALVPLSQKWDPAKQFIKTLRTRGWWTQQLLDEDEAARQAAIKAEEAKREEARVLLLEAFKKYDQDGSQGIDSGEFHSMLRDEFCEPVSREESLAAFESIDKDKSGIVEFEEFLDWYVSQVDQKKLGPGNTDPLMMKMRTKLERKRKMREMRQTAAKRIKFTFGRKKANSKHEMSQKKIFVPKPVPNWENMLTICDDHFDRHKDRFLRYLKRDLQIDVNVTRFLKSNILLPTFEHVYCMAWNFGMLDGTYYLDGEVIEHEGEEYIRSFDEKTGMFTFRNKVSDTMTERNPTLVEQHVSELESSFDRFDADESGFLDRQELRKLLRDQLCVAGHKGSDVTDVLLQVWNAVDADGNGAVSKDEFVTWYLFALENKEIHEDATLKMYKSRREFRTRLRKVLRELKQKVKAGLQFRKVIANWTLTKIGQFAPSLLPAGAPGAIKGPGGHPPPSAETAGDK